MGYVEQDLADTFRDAYAVEQKLVKAVDYERAILQKTIRNKKTCKTVLKRCQF